LRHKKETHGRHWEQNGRHTGDMELEKEANGRHTGDTRETLGDMGVKKRDNGRHTGLMFQDERKTDT
jgi:hypothetical protein